MYTILSISSSIGARILQIVNSMDSTEMIQSESYPPWTTYTGTAVRFTPQISWHVPPVQRLRAQSSWEWACTVSHGWAYGTNARPLPTLENKLRCERQGYSRRGLFCIIKLRDRGLGWEFYWVFPKCSHYMSPGNIIYALLASYF